MDRTHLLGKGETRASRDLKRIGGMMDRNKQQQLEAFGIEIEGLKDKELLAKKVAFDGLPEPSDDQQDVRLLQRLALEVALQREFGVGNTQTALEGFRSSPRVAATGIAAAGRASRANFVGGQWRELRSRAILMALPCVADEGGEGFNVGATCQQLKLMAQEEIGKVVSVLGTKVLDRD